ncbi:hypothetical protein HCN44_007760 [Aphidius gifuensis]|uniref:UBR-type domain-containing protein n=1 Tax=Aphidius gifuensis TaxID=684658 RepID=A0A834XJB7_APHGI|nr:hypothetical protein HCN44_007760 [Aphidius gifuensis]
MAESTSKRELEDDTIAVLGAFDNKNCTYDKVSIRQALYACKTCFFGDDKKQAGVCLTCSFHCHEGHELIELHKRSFRCDCGHSKFGNKKCILDKAKTPLNIENKYNQNFDGVYLWYFSKNLILYEEFICSGCMKKHSFLWRYATNYSKNDNADKSIDVSNDTICCKMSKIIIKNSERIKALASLGHVEQVNAIEEYNKMKNQLKEYLQKFAEKKKVVREEDIKKFFSLV